MKSRRMFFFAVIVLQLSAFSSRLSAVIQRNFVNRLRHFERSATKSRNLLVLCRKQADLSIPLRFSRDDGVLGQPQGIARRLITHHRPLITSLHNLRSKRFQTLRPLIPVFQYFHSVLGSSIVQL